MTDNELDLKDEEAAFNSFFAEPLSSVRYWQYYIRLFSFDELNETILALKESIGK